MLANFDRENNIVHQDDDNRFQRDTDDVTIVSALSSENPKPVWITADIAQKKNVLERAALRESGMSIFFFKNNNGAPHFQALKALAIWPTLVEYAGRAKAPTAFEVPAGRIGGNLNTKIDRLGPTAELFKFR